jgi:hypothetical protein
VRAPWRWVGIVAWAVAWAPAPARAQVSAAAQSAFDEGRQLVKEGRFAEACPKFETSEKLEPAVGTLMNLGECYEKIGRLASAWAAFVEAAGRAHTEGSPREKRAKERAQALVPKLPRIVVRAPSLAGLEVRRDDVDVTALVGTTVPVDPGEHVFVAVAPGHDRWSSTVRANPGLTVEVVVPELAVSPTPPPPAVSATPPVDVVTTPASSHRGRRIAALTIGAVGVGALAVGAIVALSGKSAYDSAVSDHCNAQVRCDPTGVDAINGAFDTERTASIVLAVGGAAAAVGLILYLTTPSDHPEHTALRLVPTVGGALVTGTF